MKVSISTIVWALIVSLALFSPRAGAEEPETAKAETVQKKFDDYIGACSPCEKVGCNQRSGWEFDFSGWAEAGIYANSHGAKTNGPMHTKGNERTDFHLDQLFLIGDAKYKTRSGFEFGGRAELAYGLDAPGMQSWNDGSFDYEWGDNRHDYGLAMYQLYATIAYKDLSVKLGKFGTPIGWEYTASLDNFFYSHSYCYWIEPSTHTGILADYAIGDRLTISAGWTTGNDTGFQNCYNDYGFLGGLTFNLTDKATFYYWMTVAKEKNALRFGDWRFEDFGDLARRDVFIQSLCFEWNPTDRFTYVLQYNLRNDCDIEAGTFQTVGRYSSYGINNHFLYQLNDRWGLGTRLEWFRDNGGFGYITDDPANYFQWTLGANWTPNDHWHIRPEIRYDSVVDGTARPFGNGRRDQFSGGVGMLYSF